MHMIMIYAEPNGWTVDYQVGTIYRHTAFVANRTELRAAVDAIVNELASNVVPWRTVTVPVSRETGWHLANGDFCNCVEGKHEQRLG